MIALTEDPKAPVKQSNYQRTHAGWKTGADGMKVDSDQGVPLWNPYE